MKVCTACGFECPREYAADHFYRRRCRDGFQPHCKTCNCKRRRQWAKDHREREREYKRAYEARVRKDPQRYGERLAYMREWQRTYRGSQPRPMGPERALMIEVAPIREAVAESGLNWSEIGYRVGIDEGAIRRGLQQEKMNAGKACRILEAIGSSPAEVGL